MNRRIGIALIIFGASMLIWTSFTPAPKEKKPMMPDNDSSIRVSVKKKTTMNWMPYLGTVLVAGGLVLVITGKRSDQE
jgi:hypothetical protein